MKFELTLALADRPGQLLKALEPIAKNGGNIISIFHERERPTEGYVPVSLVVDFPSRQNLRKTLDDLKGLGITIIKSEEVIETQRLTVILIGKIDLKTLIETKMENARVTGFEVSAPTSHESSVKIELEVPTGLVNKVMDDLKALSREENAVLISSI